LVVDKRAVIDSTRRWVSSIVIGLNFCPFAKRVFQEDRIRFVVSDACDSEALRSDLSEELTTLASSPLEAIETTLLIHPGTLERFDDYCDFLAEAERLVKRRGYRGVIQVASFHPEYRFASAAPDAVENYTNRSPYPMLHLLREESISRVAERPDDLLEIPKRNAETLRCMGRERVLELLETIRSDTSPGGTP
jgi:hypothetical protein